MVAAQKPTHCRPDESLTDHLRCLPRGLVPMPDDESSRTAEKLIALLLVTVWAAGTLAMTFSAVETTVPPHWPYFTALVFLLVGKLWDLEVQKYLPTGGNNDS